MDPLPNILRYELVQGTLQKIDLVAREIDILAVGEVLHLDVPVVCPILINDERVRLRMLQAQDRVEIAFTREEGQVVAGSIEVLSFRPKDLNRRLRDVIPGQVGIAQPVLVSEKR